MIEIYTSCFYNIRSLPPSIEPVSIARYPARNFRGRRVYTVAPSAKALKASTIEEFDALYLPLFESLDPEAFVEELATDMPSHCTGVAMLCFCEPLGLCHRRIVADWLEQNIEGLVIPEYGYDRSECETFIEWSDEPHS